MSVDSINLKHNRYGKNNISSEIELSNESSSITYYLEITNYGSTDIGIFDITGLPSGVNYSIKDYNLHDKICNDSGKCNSFINKTYELTLTTTTSYTGPIQLNFDFRTYHKVTYTNIENKGYPTEVIDGGDLNITFNEDLNKIIILSNEVELKNYDEILNGQTIIIENVLNDIEIKRKKELVAKLVSGSLDEVGSQVCIKEECFYIISNTGSSVVMLSKYNLYVGGKTENGNWTAYGDEATGIQDPTMTNTYNSSIINGTLSFSSSNYWGDIDKGTYIYNSNSNIYKYVENYKMYLESQGADIVEARLISYEELDMLNCSHAGLGGVNCSYSPEWLLSTSYWTGSASLTGPFTIDKSWYSADEYNTLDTYGVRPVIELNVDDIMPLVRIIDGDGSKMGDEICIGNECFYTISSDSNSITMLSKYNLYVGGNYIVSSGKFEEYKEEATGMQNEIMNGIIGDQPIRYGVTPFSSDTQKGNLYTDYSGSIVEKYVNNYKNHLIELGVIPTDARLLTCNEAEILGCINSNGNRHCQNAPSWVYKTSYWLGTAFENHKILVAAIGYGMFYGGHDYNKNYLLGVRPVIVIPMSYL